MRANCPNLFPSSRPFVFFSIYFCLNVEHRRTVGLAFPCSNLVLGRITCAKQGRRKSENARARILTRNVETKRDYLCDWVFYRPSLALFLSFFLSSSHRAPHWPCAFAFALAFEFPSTQLRMRFSRTDAGSAYRGVDVFVTLKLTPAWIDPS